MTQALVTNNLNNFQELMTQNKFKDFGAQKGLEKFENASNEFRKVLQDKNSTTKKDVDTQDSKPAENFQEVFNKVSKKQEKSEQVEVKVNKNQQNQENQEKIDSFTGEQNEEITSESKSDVNWTEFKEILDKYTQEASTENALDITLSKDIAQVIEQFKEIVENTTDNSDVISEDVVQEDVISELVEGFQDISKDVSLYANLQKFETINISSDVKSDVKNKISENIEKMQEFSENNDEIIDFDSNSVESMDLLTSQQDLSATKDAENDTLQKLEELLDEETLEDLNIEHISSETDAQGGETLLNQQTAGEHVLKTMIVNEIEGFDLAIEKTSTVQQQNQLTPAQIKPVEVNPSKILEQITKQIEGLQNNSKVEIVLNPEALGKISVQLVKTGEGLSAQFTVASQEVRDILMKGLDGLKDSLASQGIGVDNVSVKLTDVQEAEYNADWTEKEESNGGNRERNKQNKENDKKELFEKMMAQDTEENGNV